MRLCLYVSRAMESFFVKDLKTSIISKIKNSFWWMIIKFSRFYSTYPPTHVRITFYLGIASVVRTFQLSLDHICCVFRPAFGCCPHLKAGQTTFFHLFRHNKLHLAANSIIACISPYSIRCKTAHTLIQQKYANSWNNTSLSPNETPHKLLVF